MNLRFEEEDLRIRIAMEEAKMLLQRGFLDSVTRFPNGKRLRSGLRLARIPQGEAATPLVVSFTTENGGLGADLVVVVSSSALELLMGKLNETSGRARKDLNISETVATPNDEKLRLRLEIDLGPERRD